MPDQITINLFDVASKIVLGMVGAVVSALLYQHQREERNELLLKHFLELHELFWKESDFADVRRWISCQKAYEEIEPILSIRKQIEDKELPPDALENRHYAILEKIDKFCNLMMRAIALNPQFKNQRAKALWKRLFFNYWVVHMMNKERRPLLRWYVENFYEDILRRSTTIH